jgi:uncharacterized protein YecA (UPF0149 family)
MHKEVQSIDEIDEEFANLIKMVVDRNVSGTYPKIIISPPNMVLLNNGKMLSEISGEGIMPGRNDPCFCGSGKKFKKCCEKDMV